ncbi:hypothetical protein [Actinomadura rugatobispora]|uniref:Ferritin-like domain-containing protein n=1 Tax=Actinomadura rugatobispora TaxID=1994 RepID=A0ABW1AJU1_9ACTN|nr:hypothetical protein GCM10010200_069410 [Actinomadura rugatobispora]
MPAAGPGGVATSRRAALLGGGAALTVPLLSGCAGADGDGDRAARAPLGAGVPILVGAIAAEQDLIALYEAARRAHPSLAGRIDPALAHHREHLAVLRRHYVPGTGDRAGEGGAIPRPTPRQAPGKASQALAALREAEERAAEARAADAGRADPGLAQLLASIGACEAGHAAALAEE